MKKHLFSLAIAALIGGVAGAQSTETIDNGASFDTYPQEVGTDDGPAGSYYSNGPYYNVEGTPNLSILQGSLGLTTFGFNCAYTNEYRVADDFELEESVAIESIQIYAYQTGSSTNSSMDMVTMLIWDGSPDDPNSNIVWGDEYDDVMSATAWTGAYRVTESNPTATDRPIMVQTIETPGLVLEPGTYWIDWNVSGILTSGPWASPIVLDGVAETGNALQFTPDNGWQGLIDSGASAQQDLPFEINGEALGVHDFHSSAFSVYPNPTNKFLNINAKNKIEEVGVFNMAGQQVMKLSPKGINAALDVSSLAKGTYIVQVKINGQVQTQKFIRK